MKDAVEGLMTPPNLGFDDLTGQLKATVGELRQLSTNNQQSLQRRIDTKDQCKLLLEEIKQVQEAINSWESSQLSTPRS